MPRTYIIGHENPDVDSIVSGYLLENIYRKLGYDVTFVIPDKKIEQENLDICQKYGLLPNWYKKDIEFEEDSLFILVDHHKRNVKGRIVKILDHHPTTETIENIPYYQNEPSSSTSCLILKDYEDFLSKKDIRLACVAALVDTASFHSTKTRESDKLMIENLCKKYNFDYEEMYKTGLCLTDINDLKQASCNGLKKYNYEDYLVQSSYIQIEDITKIQDELDTILDLLTNKVTEENLKLFVFIVHDMTKFQTTVYYISENEITKKEYDQYTSRGTTIMPEVEEMLLTKQKVLTKKG